MRINNIKIVNFGSYEGQNSLNFLISDLNKNIILIGGKNGSGKTTLFTAIRLALYGPIALGFETTSPSYFRHIKKLINDNSLGKNGEDTSITLDFSMEEERGISNYVLCRQWEFKENKLIEKLTVMQNNHLLSDDDLDSFEGYIRSMIPPQLFDLFFFDGEKISEFFLQSNSARNLRDALLILCGYDTFEIVRNNFKRYIQKSEADMLNDEENRYLNFLQTLEENQLKLNEFQDQIRVLDIEVGSLEEARAEEEKQFRNAGGLLAREVEQIRAEIAKEERNREEKNEWLREYANDVLPFIIAKEYVSRVKEQIQKESSFQKYTLIKEALNKEFLRGIIEEEVHTNKTKILGPNQEDNTLLFSEKLASHIDKKIRPNFEVDNFTPIHYLSHDDKTDIMSIIKEIEQHSENEIKTCKKEIVKSIARCQNLRKQLEANQNNDYLSLFITKIQAINEQIQIRLSQKIKLEQSIIELENLISKLKLDLGNSRNVLMKLRKDNSIVDICNKSSLILEKFLPELINQKLENVKSMFLLMFKELLSKDHYIDDVTIDSNFNVTLYRNTLYSKEALLSVISKLGLEGFNQHMGEKALVELKTILNTEKDNEIIPFIQSYHQSMINLPTKVDVQSFSKGEQQIYIMALYWALIKQSNYEVPFIIDTPYARIDSSHRENITTGFFPKLSSQVIILSTDEEVNTQYYKLLQPFISKEYTITYSDVEKRTHIQEKYFFEVAS